MGRLVFCFHAAGLRAGELGAHHSWVCLWPPLGLKQTWELGLRELAELAEHAPLQRDLTFPLFPLSAGQGLPTHVPS